MTQWRVQKKKCVKAIFKRTLRAICCIHQYTVFWSAFPTTTHHCKTVPSAADSTTNYFPSLLHSWKCSYLTTGLMADVLGNDICKEAMSDGKFLKSFSESNICLCYSPAGHPEPKRPCSSGKGLECGLPPGGQAEEVLWVLSPIGWELSNIKPRWSFKMLLCSTGRKCIYNTIDCCS